MNAWLQSSGLFLGELCSWCATRGSEGTAFCTKQTLCSWHRHGYRSSKNINSDNKRPDRQAAFTDVPFSRSRRSGSHSWVGRSFRNCTFFAAGVARPSRNNVRVVESNSTRTLKVLNQKNNHEFYSLVKEIVLLKPAQIAETAQSKQRTWTGTQKGENAHGPLLKGDGHTHTLWHNVLKNANDSAVRKLCSMIDISQHGLQIITSISRDTDRTEIANVLPI